MRLLPTTGKVKHLTAPIITGKKQLDSPETTTTLKEPKSLESIRNSKQGADVVKWIYAQYERMKQQRLKDARKWTYNLAMYEGKQYLTQQNLGAAARLIQKPVPTGRVRSITNRLRPIIRTEIARMNGQQPSATVIPASGETEDIYAALAAEAMWESYYSRSNMRQREFDKAFWVALTGNGFMKTVWENDFLPKNVKVVTPIGQMPAVGDVKTTMVTPFHLFVPDLLEVDIEDQCYVFQIYTKSLYWARKYYDLPNLAADCSSSSEIFTNSYFDPAANQNAKPDSVLVIEAWIKPGSVECLPDGGFVTVANHEIVGWFDQGLPYSHEMYPYDHTGAIPTGKFYRASILDDLNPLQREYNRTRSQIIENKNLMSALKLLSPKGALPPNKITNKPGEVIEYAPTFGPPTPLVVQGLPNYVMQEPDRIIADMEDISGQHSASRGDTPGGGVTAATAIGFLQEKDDSLMSPVYASIEAATAKRAQMTLSLMVDYYDLPRIIQVVGTDAAFNALEIKGADIKNGLDIRIEGGSALPQSKQAKQALLMDMATQGFITGDDMLSMLDIGGFSRIVDRLKIDRTEAERENLKFKNLQDQEIQQYMMQLQNYWQNPEPDPNTGMPLGPPSIIPVEDWMNHAIHIRIHDDYRKGQEFAMLPEPIKALLAQHVQLHKLAMQTSMQQQMAGMAPDPSMPTQQSAQGDPMAAQQPQPQLPPGQPQPQLGG